MEYIEERDYLDERGISWEEEEDYDYNNEESENNKIVTKTLTNETDKVPLITLEEYKSTYLKTLKDSHKEEANASVKTKISCYEDDEVDPIHSKLAGTFFKTYKNRYLIAIIMSFLDLSLHYCFITKLTRRELFPFIQNIIISKTQSLLKSVFLLTNPKESFTFNIFKRVDTDLIYKILSKEFKKKATFLLLLKTAAKMYIESFPELFESSKFYGNLELVIENCSNDFGTAILGCQVQFLYMCAVELNVKISLFGELDSKCYTYFKMMMPKVSSLGLHKKITSLDLRRLSESLSFAKNLVSLSFVNLKFSNSVSFVDNITNLSSLSSLKTLVLTELGLDTKSLDKILKQIKDLKELTFLDLSENKITYFSEEFLQFIRSCSLQYLIYRHNLNYFKLDRNYSKDLEALMLSLSKNKTITQLDFSTKYFFTSSCGHVCYSWHCIPKFQYYKELFESCNFYYKKERETHLRNLN